MPRFVCPSYVTVSIDARSNDPAPVKGFGPRSRTGSLSASFMIRDNGDVAPFVRVDMIASADGASTVARVIDTATGTIIHERTVVQ